MSLMEAIQWRYECMVLIIDCIMRVVTGGWLMGYSPRRQWQQLVCILANKITLSPTLVCAVGITIMMMQTKQPCHLVSFIFPWFYGCRTRLCVVTVQQLNLTH